MINGIIKADPAMSGFSLTLENTASDGPLSRTAYMFAPESESMGGFYEGAAQGFVSDGPIVDLDGNTGLIATGHTNRIAVLNSFVRRNPCMIGKIILTSSHAANFNYPFIVKQVSPFTAQSEDRPIRLFKPDGEHRVQSLERTIETEIYLSDQEYIQIQVRNGTSITLNFEFTYFLNAAAAFRQLIQQIQTT